MAPRKSTKSNPTKKGRPKKGTDQSVEIQAASMPHNTFSANESEQITGIEEVEGDDVISEGRQQSQRPAAESTTVASTTANAPSARDQRDRIRALRNRIGNRPHVGSDLVRALQTMNWDVTQAYTLYTARRDQIAAYRDSLDDDGNSTVSIEDAAPEGSGITPQIWAGYTLQFDLHGEELAYDSNPDLERRAFAIVFRDALRANGGPLLSRSEAVLALASAQWNLDAAIERYTEPGDVRAELHDLFDDMRTPIEEHGDSDVENEGEDPVTDEDISDSELKSKKETRKAKVMAEQDRRLAYLITYTGRPDWYSLQEFLRRHNWNFVAAIRSWQRSGIPPIRHPRDRAGRREEGHGRRRDVFGELMDLPEASNVVGRLEDDSNRGWAAEPAQFAVEGERDVNVRRTSTGSHIGVTSAPVKESTKQTGTFINRDPEPPRRNCVDLTKLVTEHIRKNKYYYARYDSFRWKERRDDQTVKQSDKRPFLDWDNQDHLELIRRWSGQRYLRTTQRLLRKPAQKLTQTERDFLWKLWEDALKDLKKKNPGIPEEDLLPFQIGRSLKQVWVEKWNQKFEGKCPDGISTPRRPRTAQNLMNLSTRWLELCERFGRKPDITVREPKRTVRKSTQTDTNPKKISAESQAAENDNEAEPESSDESEQEREGTTDEAADED